MPAPMESLPVPVLRQIDSACDRFEADWKAGKHPRLENYLDGGSESERNALLRALLQLEFELLSRQQITPDLASYRARFPRYASLIDAAAQSALQRTGSFHPQASVETSVSRSSVANKPVPVVAGASAGPIPKQIGRFVIVERLGQGAFGQVFRARDPQLDREVALKVPLPGVLATAQDVERFLREARTAATMHHPNICPVYEVSQDQQNYYIVMALLKGQSLAEHSRSRKEPLAAKQTALIIRKLALALQAAHSKGIIHRDLKPANIMFDRDRKDVVIMDFGLARRLHAGDASQTRQGTLLGSPAYMSPEQARGDVQAVGTRSDIYSLGVILYELLTGRLPFTGTVTEVLGKVQHVEPDMPSKVRAGVDPVLEAICLKAMAKDPMARFASMKEMAEAVARYLKESSAPGQIDAPLPVPPPEPQLSVIAALSAEHRAETQAVVAAAVQHSTRGLWKIALFAGVPALVVGGILAVALVMLAMKEPDSQNKGGDNITSISNNSVTVILQSLPHLNDPLAIFLLDGKDTPAKQLSQPIALEPGKHELVIKKGDTIIEVRQFQVNKAAAPPPDELPPGEQLLKPPAASQPQRIIAPIVEPKGPAGLVHTFKVGYPVYGIAVALDGSFLLTASNAQSLDTNAGKVQKWDLIDLKKEPKTLPLKFGRKVALDPRGGKAAFGITGIGNNNNGAFLVWNLDKWEDEFRHVFGLYGHMEQLQYSPDGTQLLVGWPVEDGSKVTAIFDPATGKEAGRFSHWVSCWAADGKHILIGGAKVGDLELVELATKKIVRTFKGHSSPICSVSSSPDGKYVAAGSGADANAIRLWDVKSGAGVNTFFGHSEAVSTVAISPDGRRLLSGGSLDRTVRLWEIASGKLLHTFAHDDTVYEVCFTPSGQRALSCSRDGTVRLWQLPD